MVRIAKSLDTLLGQINELYPGRDKSSDGWIGDEAHAARVSDHNPNSAGIVTALDITNDPAHGLDAQDLAILLLSGHDPRIKYIISHHRIGGDEGFALRNHAVPWQWEKYTGANPHTEHVHISVNGEPGLYDDPSPWKLQASASSQSGLQKDVIATRFADETIAYADVAPGWNKRYGVALPYRFTGARPKVRVRKNDKSIDAEIMDVGPWNIDDPYWINGQRPQAESGIDKSGRRTNRAGIDLTFPADAALGNDGKGLVDWEFITDEKPVAVQQPESSLQQLIDRSRAPAQQPIDLAPILAQLALALGQRQAAPASPKALKPKDPFISPIDQVIGGQALVGWKTAIAVTAYGLLSILQLLGMVGTATGETATLTGTILTAVIATLGGLGFTAKIDRATNMLGAIARASLKGIENDK